MEKKIMIVIGLIMLLSSCGMLRYGVEKTVYEMKEEKYANSLKEKEAGGAEEKDKKIVEGVIKDILKRPINKHVQFGEITLLIPENTRLNMKVGNIVDEKTGYGIPITFSKELHCIEKIHNNNKYSLFYNKTIPEISKIAQKIISINGFKNTCSK